MLMCGLHRDREREVKKMTILPVYQRGTRMPQWVSVALIAGATLIVAAPSDARALEAGSSTDSDSEADSLIERGIALRRGGEDAQALPLFQQAEKLDPSSTRVKVHLAATYQALGQWEEADRYLAAALEDPSDPYIQKHQATLASARRTVDGHIGQLELTGGPRGAEIRLNGRLIGTLPLDETLRVEAGIYTLEARLPGHYTVTRSVALAGGALVRESLELEPRTGRDERAALKSSADRESAGDAPAPAPRVEEGPTNWWAWTFGGLAVAGGVVTAAAWVTREKHADRWNDDDQCLGPNQSRKSLCGTELDSGQRAETWMWIGGGAAAAFTAAAIGSLWLEPGHEAPTEAGVSCGIGIGSLECAGRF
jgi:tetratricopeptide repeat protein/PEGA domain-containing protein